jgi:hypothetical protein
MHIRADYAEIWLTKAFKLWLLSVGGEDALQAPFRMDITLDGQFVCSKQTLPCCSSCTAATATVCHAAAVACCYASRQVRPAWVSHECIIP